MRFALGSIRSTMSPPLGARSKRWPWRTISSKESIHSSTGTDAPGDCCSTWSSFALGTLRRSPTSATGENISALRALRSADAGDAGPLGEMLARSVMDNLYRFVVPAVAGPNRLVPLAALADKEITEGALRVAANRGRLRARKGQDGQWRSTHGHGPTTTSPPAINERRHSRHDVASARLGPRCSALEWLVLGSRCARYRASPTHFQDTQVFRRIVTDRRLRAVVYFIAGITTPRSLSRRSDLPIPPIPL